MIFVRLHLGGLCCGLLGRGSGRNDEYAVASVFVTSNQSQTFLHFLHTTFSILIKFYLVFQVANLPREKEAKLLQSKSLAEYNLSLEPKLKEAVNKLRLTHEKAVKTKNEVNELKKVYDEKCESRSLDTISTLLQSEARQAEDESEV